MISATIVGNLGKDGELRTTAGGKAVCGFSVASQGRDKSTTWVRCSIWGARGEKLAQYLTKGSKVAVSGTLSSKEYEGKTYLELDVAEIELCGGGPKREEDEAPRQERLPARQSRRDDEIPF